MIIGDTFFLHPRTLKPEEAAPLREEMLRFLHACTEPGDVLELRAFDYTKNGNFPQIVSGYYNSLEKLAEDALKIAPFSKGVYWVLNVVEPALLARRANELHTIKKEPTTADHEIVSRRFLFLDFDPKRPAEISSADSEHAAAIELAGKVRATLTDEGWPAPIIIDSGNGAGLLYKVELPADDGGLVQRVLKAAAERFSTDKVEVDEKVFNAARLGRLPGTFNRKGSHIPERPHRVAHVLEFPDPLVVVPRELLERFAPIPEPEAPKAKRARGKREPKPLDLDRWITEHGLEVKGPEPWAASSGPARRWEIPTCPWNPSHTGGSAWLVQFASGAIACGCQHNSCSGKDWHALRDLLEPAWRDKKKTSGSKRESGGEDDECIPADPASISGWITRWETDANGIEDRRAWFAKDIGDKLHHFSGGVYKPTGEEYVRKQTKRYFTEMGEPETWSSFKGEETIKYLAADAPKLWEIPPLDSINVLNGLLDVRTRKLRPHDPAHLSAIQIPVTFDGDANCPAWETFITEVFPEDAQLLPWELTAWLMVPITSIQKAVLLVGPGGNGKSTFLRALTRFLGRENVSSITLHKLEEDRFAVGHLVGKLCNCCADLPSSHLASTGTFKSLTGTEGLLTGEHKYKDAFEFQPFARLIFSANSPPRSEDASEAFFARWLVVPFERSFRGTAQERSAAALDAELAKPAELSGVLNHALDALPCVLDENRLTESDSMRRAAAEFREMTDPISVWLEANVLRHPEAIVSKQALRQAYNRDAARDGRAMENDKSFTAAVRRWNPRAAESRPRLNGERQNSWIGIGLRSAGNSADPWQEGAGAEERSEKW